VTLFPDWVASSDHIPFFTTSRVIKSLVTLERLEIDKYRHRNINISVWFLFLVPREIFLFDCCSSCIAFVENKLSSLQYILKKTNWCILASINCILMKSQNFLCTDFIFNDYQICMILHRKSIALTYFLLHFAIS
jgi:hypothetical protein